MINEHHNFGYPVRHKQKVPFAPRLIAPPEFTTQAAELARLERKLDRNVLGRSDRLAQLERALASNIHLSTKLEGNPLPLAEVRRLTRESLRRREQPREQLSRDFHRREIQNHLRLWQGLPRETWSLDLIREIHRTLLAGDDEARPGELRTARAVVVSDMDEELFIPAPPAAIAPELAALLDWLTGSGVMLHPVVAATIFFHEFESIHPFGDGNGRTGRMLFHLWIERHGLPNSRYCLIERELLGDAERYYELLARTDWSWQQQPDGDYRELLAHFMTGVVAAYREAAARLEQTDLLAQDLDPLTRRLLLRARREREWFTLTKATAWRGGKASEQTVRQRLNALVAREVLLTEGRTRGKRYRFADTP